MWTSYDGTSERKEEKDIKNIALGKILINDLSVFRLAGRHYNPCATTKIFF